MQRRAKRDWPGFLATGLLAQALLGGCASSPTAHHDPAIQLPSVSRGHINVQVVADAEQSGTPAADRQPQYRALSAEECQCLAVHNAEAANVLQADRHGRRHGAHHGPIASAGERRDLYEDVTGYAGEEVRNRRAGDALEAYYRLAEAEGRADLVRAGLAELQDQVGRARDLQGLGTVGPEVVEAAQRKLAESRGDQIELDVLIDQLNGQLKEADGLGGDGGPDYHIWPTEPLAVTGDDPDPARCVADGLARRPDLNMLRALSAGLDARTLPVAKQALVAVAPLAGGPTGGCKCLTELAADLLPCLEGAAVEAARRQIDTLLHARERQATVEIAEAARLVAARRKEAELASLRADLAGRKVKDLEERSKKGDSVRADLAAARLDALKDRGDELHAAAGFKVACARLRQAMGLLAGCPAPRPPAARPGTLPGPG